MKNSDMAWEMNRLMSFNSWPHNDSPRPSALVGAGFYYVGEGDTTRCFSCEGEVSDWKPDMYPDVVHRARFPNCLLVKGKETQNRPISASQEVFENAENLFHENSYEPPSIFDENTLVKQSVNHHSTTNPVIVLPGETQSSLMPHIARESLTNLPAVANIKAMYYEQARLVSYSQWPKPDIIQPADLARDGLFFIGPRDRVQCAFCKGKLYRWEPGDDPLEEHRKYFGERCLFVQGAQVGNVPIEQGKTKSLPQFPEYADVQSHPESYHNWNPTSQQSPDLAAARFSYTGNRDTVKCFFRAGTLKEWVPNDDPWMDYTHLTMRDPAKVSTDVIMASEAAQTLFEMGLLRVDVERAALVWTSTNKNRMPDANSLAELAMNIKNGEDQNLPCGNTGSTPSKTLVPTVSSSASPSVASSETIINCGVTPQCEMFSSHIMTKNSKQKGKYQNQDYSFQRDLKELSITNSSDEEDTTSSEHVPFSWLLDTIMASEAAQEVLDMGLPLARVLQAAHSWAKKYKRIPDANTLASLALQLDNSGWDGESSTCGHSGPSPSNSLAFNVTSREYQTPTTQQGSSADTRKLTNERKNDSYNDNPTKQSTIIDSDEAKELIEKVQQLQREVSELRDQRQCKVCQDGEINLAFLPCGHLVCCDICSQAVSRCPICRVPKLDNQT